MKRIGSLIIVILLILNNASLVFADNVYTVQPGDKLWKIAEKNNVSWKTLAEYNNLKNPDLIFPNQTLTIPDNNTSVVKPTAPATAPAAGDSKTDPVAKAPTGTYIGLNDNGVTEFLGIRYAAPIEHFKRAKDVTTTTNDVIKAQKWGYNCIQPYDEVEVASQAPCSQDCLYLNIWTKDVSTAGKPVIVWIHGGGYIWGGTTDPMYYGENFVRDLAKSEDCVFVSINYRLNFMGGCDLSVLPDYTDEYADAINLSMLDQTQALKWVSENIAAWGGDPKNITIAGHSSGGSTVYSLAVSPNSNKYVNRVIEDSGVPMFTIESEKEAQESAKKVFEILGVKSVAELVTLSDKQIADKVGEIAEAMPIGTATAVGNRCADGRVISKTWWDDLKNGSAKNVEWLIGSVNGEFDGSSIDPNNYPNPMKDYIIAYDRMKKASEAKENVYGALDPFDYNGLVDKYLALGTDKVMLMQDLYNDTVSAYGSRLIAEEQSKWNPNTYLYYWEYAPSKEDVIAYKGESAEVSPWSRALHGMDVCFALGNLENGYTEITGDSKKLPTELRKEAEAVWYNFAKTGNPNNSLISKWDAFSNNTKQTMVIKPDASWKCESNYRADAMKILSEIRPYEEIK